MRISRRRRRRSPQDDEEAIEEDQRCLKTLEQLLWLRSCRLIAWCKRSHLNSALLHIFALHDRLHALQIIARPEADTLHPSDHDLMAQCSCASARFSQTSNSLCACCHTRSLSAHLWGSLLIPHGFGRKSAAFVSHDLSC